MTNALKRPKWLVFGVLLSMILFSNYILYRTTLFGPVPDGAAVGSLFDLLVVVPQRISLSFAKGIRLSM